MSVSVTRYSGGRLPFVIPSQVFIGVEEGLADMFDRLYRGGRITYSGCRYVLVNFVNEERAAGGWDKVVYSSAYATLDEFVIRGSRFWSEGLSSNTPELEAYLRLSALQITKYKEVLSDEQLRKAYAMSRKDFLSIIAMAIEGGEPVSDLFN